MFHVIVNECNLNIRLQPTMTRDKVVQESVYPILTSAPTTAILIVVSDQLRRMTQRCTKVLTTDHGRVTGPGALSQTLERISCKALQ